MGSVRRLEQTHTRDLSSATSPTAEAADHAPPIPERGPLHRSRLSNCHAEITKKGGEVNGPTSRPERFGCVPVLAQEVEDQSRRPCELFGPLASTRLGVVVLEEAGASRQLDDRSPDVGGQRRVSVAIEAALEDPVEDWPDRTSPVPRS